jgi:hypothetical protein
LQALEAASLFDYASSLRIRSKAAAAKLRALCSLTPGELAMVLNQRQPEDLLDLMADRQQQQGMILVDAQQEDVWPPQQEQQPLQLQQRNFIMPAPYASTATAAAGNTGSENLSAEVYPSYGGIPGFHMPEPIVVPAYGQASGALLAPVHQAAVAGKQGTWCAPVAGAVYTGGVSAGAYGQVAAAAPATADDDDDDDLAFMLSLLGVAA